MEEGGLRLEQSGKWKWEVISVLRLLETGDNNSGKHNEYNT